MLAPTTPQSATPPTRAEARASASSNAASRHSSIRINLIERAARNTRTRDDLRDRDPQSAISTRGNPIASSSRAALDIKDDDVKTIEIRAAPKAVGTLDRSSALGGHPRLPRPVDTLGTPRGALRTRHAPGQSHPPSLQQTGRKQTRTRCAPMTKPSPTPGDRRKATANDCLAPRRQQSQRERERETTRQRRWLTSYNGHVNDARALKHAIRKRNHTNQQLSVFDPVSPKVHQNALAVDHEDRPKPIVCSPRPQPRPSMDNLYAVGRPCQAERAQRPRVLVGRVLLRKPVNAATCNQAANDGTGQLARVAIIFHTCCSVGAVGHVDPCRARYRASGTGCGRSTSRPSPTPRR